MRTIAHQRGVGSHNRADCFVQTLTNTLCIPYSQSIELASAYDWKASKGISPNKTYDCLKKQGASAIVLGFSLCARAMHLHCKPLDFEYRGTSPTLAAWLATPEAQKGCFAVCIRGHIFAVINGTVYDARSNPARSKIYAIYKLN